VREGKASNTFLLMWGDTSSNAKCIWFKDLDGHIF